MCHETFLWIPQMMKWNWIIDWLQGVRGLSGWQHLRGAFIALIPLTRYARFDGHDFDTTFLCPMCQGRFQVNSERLLFRETWRIAGRDQPTEKLQFE